MLEFACKCVRHQIVYLFFHDKTIDIIKSKIISVEHAFEPSINCSESNVTAAKAHVI